MSVSGESEGFREHKPHGFSPPTKAFSPRVSQTHGIPKFTAGESRALGSEKRRQEVVMKWKGAESNGLMKNVYWR